MSIRRQLTKTCKFVNTFNYDMTALYLTHEKSYIDTNCYEQNQNQLKFRLSDLSDHF